MNSEAYNGRPAFIAEPLKRERLPGDAMAEDPAKVDATASVVKKVGKASCRSELS